MPIEASTLFVADAAAWRQWLIRNGSTSDGVWLAMARKGANKPTSLTMDQAIQEALCFGWINGQGRKGDIATICQRWTPRRPKSAWAKRNVAFVEKLEKEGRMTEAGRAAVDAAKADGRWAAAYSGSATIEDHPDFVKALKESPAAQATWDNMSKGNRYTIYMRLSMLKTPAGREKRTRDFIEMLARGETPDQQKPATTRPATKAIQSRVSKSVQSQSRSPRTADTAVRRTRSGRSAPSYVEIG